MRVDWNKWGAPAFVLAVLALIVTWSRPAIIALFHYLIRYDPGKARETLLIILRDEDTKLKIRVYMEDLLVEKWNMLQRALDIAEANRDILAQVKFTQEAQGHAIQQIEISVKEVPHLTEALERISESMETFAQRMESVADFMSRADERERLRDRYERGELPERRHESRGPHPHEREGDPRK